MTARAHSQVNPYNSNNNNNQSAPTSLPAQNPNIQPDLDSKPYNPNASNSHPDSQDPFGSHQTNDAANGLFMLAQAGGQRNAQPSYGHSQQQPSFSQAAQKARVDKVGSIGSNISASTDAPEQYSDDAKPQARNGRGKKTPSAKATPAAKRKTEDTPAKTSANKKQRGNSIIDPDEDMDDEDMDEDNDIGADGKKMTDEEKRKNFLERNR